MGSIDNINDYSSSGVGLLNKLKYSQTTSTIKLNDLYALKLIIFYVHY